jgi:ubiquinone/menaquinone biosynthesis C-methylase UbiE
VTSGISRSPWRIARDILLGIPLLALLWLLVARLVRAVYKFPMPEFMANVIDNPLRRRLQPPDATAVRHGLEPGMAVLEVGPGNGTYTLGAARRVGPAGRVVAVDIEPKMVERVVRRAADEGVTNVDARVADVFALPFDDGSFDAAFMIFVIGEIPTPERALREIHRVLRPGGTLACSEVLVDPDSPSARTLARWATAAGFQPKEKIGNIFYYTWLLERPGG